MSNATTKTTDWKTLVEEQEGRQNIDNEYEFSNGRNFKRDDNELRGIYTPPVEE